MARIGWVDTFTATRISGWAADDENPGLQVSVDIFVNGNLAATVPATVFRDDLRLAGIGDGCKSFQFDPDRYLRRGWNYVQVKYSGSDILVGRGQRRLNTRPLTVSASTDPFLAALAAYYPFPRTVTSARLGKAITICAEPYDRLNCLSGDIPSGTGGTGTFTFPIRRTS